MESRFSYVNPDNITSSGFLKESSLDRVDYASQLANNGDFITKAVAMGVIVFTFSFNESASAQTKDLSMHFSKPDITILEKVEREIRDDIQSQQEQMRHFWKQEVSSLALLKEGWDGEQAKRVSTTAINNVLNMLNSKQVRLDLIQDIYANEAGTVTIEWDNGNKEYAGIQVGRQLMSYYVTLHSGEILKDYEPINAVGLKELYRNISLL